jgi:hypothetical protein
VPDTRCLVDLTPAQRDYLLTLIEDERPQFHDADRRRVLLDAAQDALEDALEVTDPWHMLGTRADGAAVGRGQGPIGGCGQSLDCTPPTLAEVRDGPFGRQGAPMGRIAWYVGMAVRAPLSPDLSGRVEVDLGEFDGVRYVGLIPKSEDDGA